MDYVAFQRFCLFIYPSRVSARATVPNLANYTLVTPHSRGVADVYVCLCHPWMFAKLPKLTSALALLPSASCAASSVRSHHGVGLSVCRARMGEWYVYRTGTNWKGSKASL